MSAQFLNSLLSDAFDLANDPELGGLRLNCVLLSILQRLEDAGNVSDPRVSYFVCDRGNIGAEVHGWSVDIEDDVVQLYACIDATADVPLGEESAVVDTNKDRIDRAFRRLESFVRNSLDGRFDDVEESQPVRELIEVVRAASSLGQMIELHVLTTGTISDRAAAASESGGLKRVVWDLTRLARVCGTGPDGAIQINFLERFGTTLPCLVSPPDSDGVQVLLTRIPGQMLADIYNDYRSALLERNVRSFLQFTGKVNKGIRDTLRNEPERFLAYNNGLSTTAGNVGLRNEAHGTAQIQYLSEFQIVNGGQTTASIAAAARRDRVDLSRVVVPMKLTVVPPDKLQSLVPRISKYANTQNRIQDADFYANASWHVALERLSRNSWAAPTEAALRGTRWFYERSRGQYADELAAQATPAGRRKFRHENPPSQRFSKTDVAKFWLSWDELPHVVSLGAQKCFSQFMEKIVPGRPDPDEPEFRRVVALAILFRSAEQLYGRMGFTGYRAQVITYSVARLSRHLGRQLPVAEIWRTQELPQLFEPALRLIITGVRDALINPPSGRNITEWCKKQECWMSVLDREMAIALPRETCDITQGRGNRAEDAVNRQNGMAEVTEVIRIGSDAWLSLGSWAKQTNSLLLWQRSLAHSIGRLLMEGRQPSPKQAKQAMIMWHQAHGHGFAPGNVPDR